MQLCTNVHHQSTDNKAAALQNMLRNVLHRLISSALGHQYSLQQETVLHSASSTAASPLSEHFHPHAQPINLKLQARQTKGECTHAQQVRSDNSSPTFPRALATGLLWCRPARSGQPPGLRPGRRGFLGPPVGSPRSASRRLRSPPCGRWCTKCASCSRVSDRRAHLPVRDTPRFHPHIMRAKTGRPPSPCSKQRQQA